MLTARRQATVNRSPRRPRLHPRLPSRANAKEPHAREPAVSGCRGDNSHGGAQSVPSSECELFRPSRCESALPRPSRDRRRRGRSVHQRRTGPLRRGTPRTVEPRTFRHRRHELGRNQAGEHRLRRTRIPSPRSYGWAERRHPANPTATPKRQSPRQPTNGPSTTRSNPSTLCSRAGVLASCGCFASGWKVPCTGQLTPAARRCR